MGKRNGGLPMIPEIAKEHPGLTALGIGLPALAYANREAIAKAALGKAKVHAWKLARNPKFVGLAALGMLGNVVADTNIEQKIVDKIF